MQIPDLGPDDSAAANDGRVVHKHQV